MQLFKQLVINNLNNIDFLKRFRKKQYLMCKKIALKIYQYLRSKIV